ncbi:uncharacterized protein LOC142353591 [Convolutriloba macropyga]|uniref:uncharacterized protein LOC142353591 n=1 Tax=Convolutriloba macropyga TaxID=536237 RepID=UPI003F524763
MIPQNNSTEIDLMDSEMGAFTSDANQRFLFITSYLLLFIGIGAFFANSVIFLLLLQKINKLASELLVLCNLLIDALYGLVLFSVGFCNVNNVYLSEITGYLPLQCIIRRVPYTFLVLASLFLLIIMTLNRYVAVKVPFRYKILFKIANVIKYLIGIVVLSLVFASIDLALCIADPFEQEPYSDAFTIVWIYMKILLIGIVTILMFVMYNSISKQFVGNFWAPILLPFRALFVCDFHCHEHDSMTSITTNHPEENVDNFSAHEHETDDQNEDGNIIAPAEKPNPKKPKMGILLESPKQKISPPMFKGQKVSLELKHPKLSNGSSRASDRMSSANNSPCHKPVTSAKQKADQKALMEQKRQQKKHHLTTMFFFISIIFILVSAPNSANQVLAHLFPNVVSLIFQWRLYLITETLYGLNFLLNPYLYSFNNSYIKQKFRELLAPLRLKKKSEHEKSNTRTAVSSATKFTKAESRKTSRVVAKRIEDYDV